MMVIPEACRVQLSDMYVFITMTVSIDTSVGVLLVNKGKINQETLFRHRYGLSNFKF